MQRLCNGARPVRHQYGGRQACPGPATRLSTCTCSPVRPSQACPPRPTRAPRCAPRSRCSSSRAVLACRCRRAAITRCSRRVLAASSASSREIELKNLSPNPKGDRPSCQVAGVGVTGRAARLHGSGLQAKVRCNGYVNGNAKGSLAANGYTARCNGYVKGNVTGSLALAAT